MISFGNVTVKTKLLTSFAAITILVSVFGYFGSKTLVICSAVITLAGGAIISTSVSADLRKLSEFARKIEAGEMDASEVAKNNELGEVAASFRKVIENQKDLAHTLNELAIGNFAVNFTPRGERDNLGKALQLCIHNGRMLEQEMDRMAETIKNGSLRERCNDAAFRGAYGKIVNSINELIDMLVRTPSRSIKVLTKVLEGDLTARLTGTYTGDHAILQSTLNQTIKTLDDALSRVALAAEQVSAASGQISAGSQRLSQKAAEQASSIEEVSSNLTQVAAMSKQNTDNSKEARSLSVVAESAVEAGVESMMRLSEAINRIKASSDSTAKIIKTIDEIAFQTNLLALNAAVEAARAGDAGKGFAVVAEEVRNLAMRSAEAAKNTATLIEESVKNSESGVALNQEVLKNLKDINDQVKKVGSVMAEIAEASEQQTRGIEQANAIIDQMTTTTQEVAANSQESASGAQELSAQADELKSMVHAFCWSGDAGSVRSATPSPQNVHAQHAPRPIASQEPAHPERARA
jgi:methyl-accepting chemotaxis protein